MKINVELTHVLAAHRDCIYTCFAYQPNEFLTAGGDGKVLKWNLSNTHQAHLIAQTDSSIYYLNVIDQNQLIVGTNKGELHVINMLEKEIIGSIYLKNGIFTGTVLKDTLLLFQTNGIVTQVSLRDFKVQQSLSISNAHLRCATLLMTDNCIAVGTSGREIIILNHHLQVIKVIPNAHFDSIFSIITTTENKMITGGKDARIKLWNIASWEVINDVPGHLFTVNSLIYNEKNNWLISGSRDKSIKIWEADTLLLHKVVDRTKIQNASSHSVNSLCWLSNNEIIAVGDDKLVRTYHIEKLS